MTSSVLRIAVSGLQAAQAGLATAGHNIANVNTPGYSRQEAIQANLPGQFTGGGYVGRGVTVATILRHYDGLLVSQQREAASAQAHYSAANLQASALDNLFGDSSVGLSPALGDFFSGLNSLANAPGDASARQAALSSAQALATRVQLLDDAIRTRSDGIDQRIDNAVGSINTITGQVASINREIALATARGQPPNDLLDQRDKLLSDLNQLAQVKTVPQSDGTMNVFLSNGQALVVGETGYKLTAGPDAFDPQRRAIGLQTPAGFLPLDSSNLFGGELGGLLAARRDVVDVARNTLGRIAISLASAFNAQHRLGQDKLGAAGGDFFAAGSPWVAGATTNTGNATLTAAVSSANALTTSDYDLSFGATGWTVRRASDGQVTTYASLPATLDGVTIGVGAGTPAIGDRFRLSPTRDGATAFRVLVTDPQRIAAGLPIRAGAASANAGTGAISAGTVVSTGANLQQPVTITFTGPNTFNVSGTGTGSPTGLAYTPGMSVSYNGWSVTLSGSPAAGDTFSIGPNTSGTGDNRNALALAGLQTGPVVGGSSVAGEYGRLVASVGTMTHEWDVAASAQGALADEAMRAVQSVSGVNLDEEAANLMKYQQAYQASAKVVQIAGAMFDALLEIGR